MNRKSQDPLTNGHLGEYFVYQQGRALGHTPGTATGAKATSFAAESNQTFVVAIFAANPQETVFKAATMEEVVEFFLDVAWKILASSFQRGLEGWVVLLNQPLK